MDLLEQGRERIVIAAGRRHRTSRERAAKRGSDPGLVGQILNLDDSTVHGNCACGVLFNFN